MNDSTIEIAGLVALVLVRTSVILGAAAVLNRALARGSAALRHIVWLFALVGAAEVVLLSPVVPSFELGLVRLPQLSSVPDKAETSVSPSTPGNPIDARGVRSTTPAEQRENFFAAVQSIDTPDKGLDLVSLVVSLWMAGAGIVLAFRLMGGFSCRALLRRSQHATDPKWIRMLLNLVREKGMSRVPSLAFSAEITGPLVLGVVEPTIVMPVEAKSWSEADRRSALLHEMAHIQRHDPASRLIATIACAICWFHPGAWMSARRMKWESEAACDDFVILSGEDEAGYASQLVALARNSIESPLKRLGTIGMASRHSIDFRLTRILDTGTRRDAPSRRSRFVFALVAVGISATLACVRPAFARSPISENVFSSDTTFSQTIAAGNANSLSLTLATTADVEVTGWDKDSVQVIASLRGIATTNMPRLEAGAPSGVSFSLNRLNGADLAGHHYLLAFRVPRRFNVEQNGAGAGALRVAGIRGFVDARKGGGRADFSRVLETIRFTTGNGDITADSLPGESMVKTNHGDIAVGKTDASVSMHTSRGSIEIASAAAPLRAETSHGDVTVTFARASSVSGESRLASASGDVTARIPEGMAATFVIDAEVNGEQSSNSRIHSDWPVSLQTTSAYSAERGRNVRVVRGLVDVGGGGRIIRLATSNGSVRLTRSQNAR